MWARCIYRNSIAQFSDERLHREKQVYDIGGCIGNLIVPMQRLRHIDRHSVHIDVDKICNGYGFRPTNVTDALVIHVKAANSSHLNSIGDITPCMRSSQITRFVKFCIAALYSEIPTETDILCILIQISRWLESLDPTLSKPCIFIGCEQGLNRTGYIVVNILVRLYNLNTMDALRRFTHVRPPGITKTHFISSLFKRFGPLTVPVSKCLPPVFFSQKQLMRITGRHTVESRRVHNPVPMRFHTFTEHVAFEALMRDKPNKLIASYLRGHMNTVINALFTLEANHHVDLFTKRFYVGFNKPVPCDTAIAACIKNTPSDWAVSLKADGIHVCILCTQIGTFLLERGRHASPPVTLPDIWRDNDKVPLGCTLLEGERIGDMIWVYDILFSHDMGIGKKTPFRTRYNNLVGLYRHNQPPNICIKPFKRLDRAASLSDLHFPQMPPTDGLVIYSRGSLPCDALIYKVKEQHTVELQVTDRVCYARSGEAGLQTLPIDIVPNYTLITTIDATDGIWECNPVVVQGNLVLFRPIKQRTDTSEPNQIEPTITSCINMTISPFHPSDLFL